MPVCSCSSESEPDIALIAFLLAQAVQVRKGSRFSRTLQESILFFNSSLNISLTCGSQPLLQP